MFEFSIARKYLLPRKKHLSRSLISLMSIGVITLVVWLVLLFLSINEGIQNTWLGHLTSVNAPIQVTPKDAYYNSYYYKIDSHSAASDYTEKTIGQKLLAGLTDPYDPSEDAQVPYDFPLPETDANGKQRDLIKELFSILNKTSGVTFDEYEVAAGMMQLKLTQYDPLHAFRVFPTKTLLSQAIYLRTFSETAADQKLLPASVEDIEKTLGALERLGKFEEMAPRIFTHLDGIELTTDPDIWSFSSEWLPENVPVQASKRRQNGRILYALSETGNVTLCRKGHTVFVDGKQPLDKGTLLYCESPCILAVHKVSGYNHPRALQLDCETNWNGVRLAGKTSWRGISLSKAIPQTTFSNMPDVEPLWAYHAEGKLHLPQINGFAATILPKTYRANGARCGETGNLTYAAVSASALQEQMVPLFVVGFYDPGVMNVGMRFMLTDQNTVHQVNASSSSLPIDRTLLNGLSVWHKDLSKTRDISAHLAAEIKQAGLDTYFSVTPFYEYDFAKELLTQFQSDQYLFSLIATLILVVACSNIITLSVLLVNDKKKEIGVLRSMGARTRSIALIFALCGVFMGVLSTGLGTLFAYLTLKNIDTIIGWISAISGQPLFAEAFYGTHLPSTLSSNAVMFVVIATPVISLLAGLIPAVKACRLQTAAILRGDA